VTAASDTPIAAPTEAEYERLRTDAGLTDRSNRLRMSFTGAKAAETITGLVTNDVLALQPGHGAYAAALTPKGKIIADLRVFCRTNDDFLVDVPAAAGAGFAAMIGKYVNPRLARYTDVTADLSCIGVMGPYARQVVAHALGTLPSEFDLLPPYAHAGVGFRDGTVMVVRSVDYGVEGFDCFVRAADADALRESLRTSGAVAASADALEVLRIEAGRPAWGIDITDDTLAQEGNLDLLQAISYTKGCYTGQETVARVHFRGHVNRHLRGLRAGTMPPGPVVVVAGDKEVGDVRSRGISPRVGPIALAMLRREVEHGTAVTLRTPEAEYQATVTDLPFAT
jgi:folate-binding protein YgfZ